MTGVDYKRDAELIEKIARAMREVEYSVPRWRANTDMAAVAISLVRGHDARREADHEHEHDRAHAD